MPNYNTIVPDKLTRESLIKLSNDIVSNQRLDDDVIHNHDYVIHNYYDMERFDLEHHAINRHDRRVIKSKYRKLNKRRNR